MSHGEPARTKVIRNLTLAFAHRTLHDMAMHSGISEAERLVIQEELRNPERKSAAKQTKAVKARRRVLRKVVDEQGAEAAAA